MGKVYQKRFPRLCGKCKIPLSNDDVALKERLSILKADLSEVYIRSDKGCRTCNHRGVKGTIVCMELVMPNHAMRQAIAHGDEDTFSKEWVDLCAKADFGDSVETSLYHALRHMALGDISPKHLETRFGVIDSLLLTEKTRTWDETNGFSIPLS